MKKTSQPVPQADPALEAQADATAIADAEAEASLDAAPDEQKDGPGTPDSFVPLAFTSEAEDVAAQAPNRRSFDPTDEAYLAHLWDTYCRETGSLGDFSGATQAQQRAFRRIVVTVARDAQKED